MSKRPAHKHTHESSSEESPAIIKSTAATGKEVIYIDIDDEITTIIDKVRSSKQKIVALVLPKRATMLQSIVNMKLLKRTADDSKKNVVLITAEAGLLPLAGSVGLHVAKSLQSRPEIPDAPTKSDAAEEMVEPEDETPDEPIDGTKSIGELSGDEPIPPDDDTIELDDDDDIPLASAVTGAGAATAGKPSKGKDKKLKVPNFSKFRMLLVVGIIAVILLGVLAYVCAAVLPKAQITVKTDSTAVNTATNATLKTGDGVAVDTATNVLPAHAQSTQKTASQQAGATGQQNNGQKASGSVTIKNCTDSAITIPSGNGVTANGNTYITQTALSLPAGNFTSGGNCKTTGSHIGTVNAVAQQAGAKYNMDAGAAFSVTGFSSSVSGTGSAFAGGTDDISKIVTQADIDGASQKISAQDTAPIKQQLKTDLTNAGYIPIEATFNAGSPDTKTSAKAGDKADNVTVTQTTTYTMLGVKKDDLQKIIAEAANKKIDTKKQSILDYGLDKASFTVQSQDGNGADVSLQTVVIAGPQLNADTLKKAVAGQKSASAKDSIKQNPGVTDVTVHLSPFWVTSIPKKTSKITLTVEKPKVTVDAGTKTNQ